MTKTQPSWSDTRAFRNERHVFLRTCEAVNTPRSLSCYLLVKYKEYDQYLQLPAVDIESVHFADDYLVTEMLSKNPLMPTSFDRREAAIAKWREAEDDCRATNDFLSAYREGRVAVNPAVQEVITRIQDIILSILGTLESRDLKVIEDSLRFGPGSTSSVSGSDVMVCNKYVSRMHVTPRLYPYWHSIRTASRDVELRAYNKVTFVPKNSKIDRAIAVEPHLNITVQLGIGTLIRKKLRRAGLCLDTQADRNRRLAAIAHSSGLATVDLSSASDTIASELVWLLLPYEWATLVDLPRSEYSLLDGEEIRLQKFSSMGNGYTFELESLIFWSLARACGDADAVAFGDDIIIKRDCVPLLSECLSVLGFRLNTKKTFVAGRFFESCGHDYLDGVMVRPIYLKGRYHDSIHQAISIANKLRWYSHSRSRGLACDGRFLSAWLEAIRLDPRSDSTYCPASGGDAGVWKDFDECCPVVARHGHQGYIANVYRHQAVKLDVSGHAGAYHSFHALRGDSDDGSFGTYHSNSPRGRVSKGKLGGMVVPVWDNLGPWI